MRLNYRGSFTDVAKGMAMAWFVEGISIRCIAKRLNVGKTTVSNYLKKARRCADASLKTLPRPPCAPSRAVCVRRRFIKRIALEESTDRPGTRKYPSTHAIARKCRSSGVSVSVSTVRRDLLSMGFSVRHRQRGVAFTQNDEINRLRFAKTCKATDVIFSDEKMFDCNDHGCRTEWVPPGAFPGVREYMRWSPKVHIWGMIGVGVKRLVFLPEGAITARLYKLHCLQRHVVPTILNLRQQGRDPVFMQDGARAHTAHANLTYLGTKGIVTLDWPARSPDLNPIENLWAHIQRLVSDRGPTDQEELRAMVQAEWDAIPQTLVDDYVRSFEERLSECRRTKGQRLRR